MENVRKHKDIKIIKTDNRRNYLVSEPNYRTTRTKIFARNSIDKSKKTTTVKMNKPAYLGLSILNISKIVMYEFWYDHIKPKYGDKEKLCYTDADCFIVRIKTEDVYAEIVGDVEERFDNSNCEVQRPLPMEKKIKK